jgi:hypothetical protein
MRTVLWHRIAWSDAEGLGEAGDVDDCPAMVREEPVNSGFATRRRLDMGLPGGHDSPQGLGGGIGPPDA